MAATFAELTSLALGGPAPQLTRAAEREQLIAAARAAWSGGEDWMVLGGGSNVVVSDEGFSGPIVLVATRGIELLDAPGSGSRILRVQAGEPWDAVVEYAVEHDLAGIEALSGIPGSSGAAPIQNIGAYGQELGTRLIAVEFLDHDSGSLQRIVAGELQFGYRTSVFKQGRLGLVVSIELELAEQPLSAPIAYAQLAATLGVQLGDRVPLRALRRAVLALRSSKGMVLSPRDPDSVSAGSFFTNPVVSENFARSLPKGAPRWPLEGEAPPQVLPLGAEVPEAGELGTQHRVKLSAAWLIEQAGVHRGFSLPGSKAAISGKHTLAIVNTGGATAEEVAELARYVRQRVGNDFGIELQPEPVLVGLQL